MNRQRHFTFYETGTDKIQFYGTARELVDMGYFRSVDDVHKMVYFIKKGKITSREVFLSWTDELDSDNESQAEVV